MTAIVAVLNKHAVAIAADSAVTMGNTHKVVNCGNKIFTLSKYHPIAIMTYGNANFMGVPWDIIVKEYRKQLQKRGFAHVAGYKDNFIGYLKKKNYFCDDDTKHIFLRFVMESFYDINVRSAGTESAENITEFSSIKSELSKCLIQNKKAERCIQFESYTQKQFERYSRKDFESFYKSQTIPEYGSIQIPNEEKTLFEESFFYYICTPTIPPINTGLVFVGYGEKDLYPSLIPINVSIAFDGKLKCVIEKGLAANASTAFICPFAQIDVIQTIIRGVSPSFYNIISNVVGSSVKSYTDEIVKHINDKGINEDVVGKIDINGFVSKTVDLIKDEMFKSYTNPLMKTVDNLDKEDMANMAESFISLTSLVRRMSPHEETVGGPVDVAVISKGDGFVWINRKHYFKPELNKQFFDNYYG